MLFQQRAYKEEKIIKDAQAEAAKLEGLDIKLTAKAGEGGKLFGSLTNADLAEALVANGVELERKYITIPGGNIKRLGNYEATLRFHREVIATLPFSVVAEEK